MAESITDMRRGIARRIGPESVVTSNTIVSFKGRSRPHTPPIIRNARAHPCPRYGHYVISLLGLTRYRAPLIVTAKYANYMRREEEKLVLASLGRNLNSSFTENRAESAFLRFWMQAYRFVEFPIHRFSHEYSPLWRPRSARHFAFESNY